MEFQELIKVRRSCRCFGEESPGHADLTEILQKAQQAPSWKNSQTARTYVAESAEISEQLRSEGLPSFNQKSSANAGLIVTTFIKDISGFTNGAPDNEMGNAWGAYDLGLRDAYLVLAAADAGYDTLIMGIRDAAKIREILSIPENEEIMSVIAIGKKAKDTADRKRMDITEVSRFY